MMNFVEDTRKQLEISGRSPKTANSYVSHLRRLVNHFGEKTGDLTKSDLRDYLEDLVSEGKSLSYINQAQSAIRYLYSQVLKKDNPLPGPGVIAKKVPLHGVFTRDEIAEVFQHVHDLKYRLSLMFIYSSGLRVSETAILRREHVDLDNNIIHVYSPEGKFLRDTILAKTTGRILGQYLDLRTDPSPYVFPGRGRTSFVSARTIQRAFTDALAEAGIDKKATLGWLRHSFAVHLLEDGTDRKMVQRLLGISTPSMITPYLKLAKNRTHLRVLSPLDRF
ncbi:MAG: tyrosine-type recombinase/integrase [Candidatus Fermentibacteraceae bacterium]|nr:tyrosine-type recombinase/integrase [Candidatus Fermentibacteraceae bacterium]